MSIPCIFFDRDGIVNVAPSPEEYYVLSVERFFLMPEFVESLRVVSERGYPAVLVTNQKCVHRGLITLEGVDAIHRHLRSELGKSGLGLLDIYVSPHGGDHPDRKPAPGMLLRAARDHNLDLARSWMIGDSERDVQAGLAAGCKNTVLVKAGEGCTSAHIRLQSMGELPGYLSSNLPLLR